MRTSLLLLGIVLALGGCAAVHEPEADIAQGIYQLDVHVERDGCAPARVSGSMGPVAVEAAEDAVHIEVPDGSSLARVTLRRRDELHTAVSVRAPRCEEPTLFREWTILEAPGGFDVLFRERWEGLASCSSMRSVVPAVPSADCEVEQRLEYRLAEACLTPCEIEVGLEGARCSCR